jgi:hypothetical protein
MQIDSHQSFRRYDAVGDSWITGEMRALQRDFSPERLAPELGANRACAIDGWERNLRVFCKLSGLITKADWNDWNAELCEPYPGIWFDEYGSDAFGADRPMFGSDWPVCLPAGSYDRVKGLVADFVRGRPQAEQSGVFGETAAG